MREAYGSRPENIEVVIGPGNFAAALSGRWGSRKRGASVFRRGFGIDHTRSYRLKALILISGSPTKLTSGSEAWIRLGCCAFARLRTHEISFRIEQNVGKPDDLVW